MIAKTKTLVKQHWKTALTWLLLPTVLVAAFYAYKHFKKPKNGADTEGVADTLESRVSQLNKCFMLIKDGENDPKCGDLLQQIIGEARSNGKDIIQLDGKYVVA